MGTTTILTSGSLTLARLQKLVQQQEGIFGPLVALAIEGDRTVLTLQIGSAPQPRAELEAYSGSQPPDKPGYTLVCAGPCLIQDASTPVAAYRKKA